MRGSVAVAIAYSAFVAIACPTFFPALTQSLPDSLLYCLPYLSALLAGVVVERLSKPASSKQCLLLGGLISLSFGGANLIATYTGIGTDLPGLNYSIWVTLLSLPVTVFLVFAGAGLNTLWDKPSNAT